MVSARDCVPWVRATHRRDPSGAGVQGSHTRYVRAPCAVIVPPACAVRVRSRRDAPEFQTGAVSCSTLLDAALQLGLLTLVEPGGYVPIRLPL